MGYLVKRCIQKLYAVLKSTKSVVVSIRELPKRGKYCFIGGSTNTTKVVATRRSSKYRMPLQKN